MRTGVDCITLRFVQRKDLGGWLIMLREQTCMPFIPTHVECVTPAGMYLGERRDGGMRARDPSYDKGLFSQQAFVKLPCGPTVVASFYAYMSASLREPYDWKAILGFAVPWHAHLRNHAICSAKVLLGLRAANYFRWPITVPAHLVSPRDLMMILSTHVEIPH